MTTFTPLQTALISDLADAGPESTDGGKVSGQVLHLRDRQDRIREDTGGSSGEAEGQSEVNKLRVLIGCEESQTVCKAFRARGHEAYSCDIQDPSGGHPEWHIKGDIFHTLHSSRFTLGLDFLGAHPECRYLANSGVRWLYNPDGSRNEQRWKDMENAALFFKSLLGHVETVGRGYLENPIMHKHAMDIIRVRPTQIIHPWQFGHGEQKATCLWLVNLPKLEPTEIVEGREQRIWKMAPGPDRAKLRSKTFPGIGNAMASQWSEDLTVK